MEERKKVLMIAYFFPPIGGSGALRPFKLAKYLPDFDWNPVILTVKNPDWYYAQDKELLEELPTHIRIIRTFMLRSAWIYRLLNPSRSRNIDKALSRFLIQPDDQIGWIPFAYLSGIDIIHKSCVKAIYSTSSPLSCHLIAYLIHKKTGLPWVADFRDEWYENPEFNFPTSLHRRFHYHLERTIVNTAQKVIAPAPEFSNLLAKHCSSSNKFKTITMGFDPEDFYKHAASKPIINKENKFVLAFSGLFYGSFRPFNLLKAIYNLIEEGMISSERIKVQFVGNNTASEIGFQDYYGICEFTGFVSHKKVLRYINDADALLLLLSKERGKHVIPSKTFEYMATGKPILAIVPCKGEVANIIRNTNTGIIADYDDIENIKKSYFQLYKQWEEKTNNNKPDLKEMAKYNQRNLTETFASLLNELAQIEGN